MNDQTPIAWTSLTPEQKGEVIRPLITVELMTYAQIARKLGTTRNAIAAAADRHNIASPLTSGHTGERGSKGGSANWARQPKKSGRPKMSRIAPTQPVTLPDDLVDKTPLRKGAWDTLPGTMPRKVEHHKRDEHECCWPIGDGPILFCCAPAVTGKQYCERHNAIAFKPRETRKGTTA